MAAKRAHHLNFPLLHGLGLLLFLSGTCGMHAEEQAGGEKALSPQSADLVSKAELAAIAENIDEVVKLYQKAMASDGSIALHRRMARLYFETAERIVAKHRAEFQESKAEFEAARINAWEDKRGVFKDSQYKKFNPENPQYKAALEKHKAVLEKYNKSKPFYDKAMAAYNAVLRLAKGGTDFEAAGHVAICMSLKEDQGSILQARKMLNAFLESHKSSSSIDPSLYGRCQVELDRISKDLPAK